MDILCFIKIYMRRKGDESKKEANWIIKVQQLTWADEGTVVTSGRYNSQFRTKLVTNSGIWSASVKVLHDHKYHN